MSSKTKTTDTKDEVTPALVPKLRFPEFRGLQGWKPSVLADACDMQAGKFVSASNISERNQAGLFPCYGGNGLRGYTATHTHNGTYPLIGRQGALCGNVRRASGQFHATEHAVVATPREAIDVGWLYYSLDLLNLNRFATGQAQPGLSVDVLEDVALAIPLLEAEQQKVAECLSSVDELMAAQARKVDALKTHKKGLMQQLFPAEGETQPRLRFPEFQKAGEWTEDALGNVCAVLNNRRRPITSSDRKPGSYRYYGASGVVDYVDNYIFDERVVLVGEDGAKWGAFERTAFIVEGKFWVNNHAHVLKPHGVNDALLENYLTMADLGPFVTGAAPPKLTLGKLKEIPVPIPPDEKEGEAIASCLSSLDALITAEIQKHEALKTHKKCLMQQLFPSPEEVEA